MEQIMTQGEVEDRLEELNAERSTLLFLRDVYYWHAEGYIDIDNGHVYPKDTNAGATYLP